MARKKVEEKNVINNSSEMEEVKKGSKGKKTSSLSNKDEKKAKTTKSVKAKDSKTTKDKVEKKDTSKSIKKKEIAIKKDVAKKETVVNTAIVNKKDFKEKKESVAKKQTTKRNASKKDTTKKEVTSKDNGKTITENKEVILDKDKETEKSKEIKKNKEESSIKNNTVTRRKRNSTAKANSIVVDVLQDGLENTGAIKQIDSGDFFSEILNNKVITIEKDDKKEDNKSKKATNKDNDKEKFDGKFKVDILDILIIIVITAIVSCVFTGFILNYQYKKASGYLDSSIIGDSNVQNFLSLYSEILSNYYEDVDPEAIMKAAMKGMMSYLEDTYSIYLSDDESDDLTGMLDSSYEGIGIVIQNNRVVGVYKNSSAAEAGIKANDEIIRVNGIDINSENYMDIGEFLKKDEDNILVIKRDGEELNFVVHFSKVNIPTTSSTTIEYNNKKIGYIHLTSFSTLSFEDFQESLMEVENEGTESLIIDLRNNSGGYLKAAYDIASIFLEKGKKIYSLEQKDKITDYIDETKESRDYSIIVLVNNSSASASEVLAAALHDSYEAKLVGKTTYGKGTVQTIKQFDDDSIVKYTSAKWLRPNGECINGVGIVPDYEVDIEYDNAQVYDKQLDKAIELLSK